MSVSAFLNLKKYSLRNVKNIIFGNVNSANYDGIHLLGEGASRHLTYRAVQKISKIITKPPSDRASHSSDYVAATESESLQDNHFNCPQARYQRAQAAKSNHGGRVSGRSYADVVGSRQHKYNVPTKNFFAPLNY